jgi:putative transposase
VTLNFKYRIYPTKQQETNIEKCLYSCSFLYNLFLEERKNNWEKQQKNTSVYDQLKKLPKLKKIYPELKSIHSQVLQNVGIRLDLAFQAFFRRYKNGEKPGYPRFKSRYRYSSFTYTQFNLKNLDKEAKKIFLSKIGNVYIELHRELLGKPKTATIIKTASNKYYLVITCVDTIKEKFNQTEKEIGIDVGILSFATLSNGKKINNPRFFETEQKKLAKKQRKFQKAKENKKNIKKSYRALVKVHERITNKRNDFSHKTSISLVKKYKIICIEDINTNEIIKKRWCNKQILDAAWSKFIENLTYKAEYAGCKLIKCNPAYTSQTCSKCGTRTVHELKDRQFNCKHCNFMIDRDENAAKNILRIGLDSLG